MTQILQAAVAALTLLGAGAAIDAVALAIIEHPALAAAFQIIGMGAGFLTAFVRLGLGRNLH